MIGINKIISLSLLMATSQLISQADKMPRQSHVVQFINEFCESEFSGLKDFRVIHSKWDPAVLSKVKKYNDMEPGYFNVLNDPLLVVDKFEVKDVINKNNQGVATILYHYVAKTEKSGMNRSIIFENGLKEEKVRWSFSGGKFFIHNPVVAKISIKALVKEYEDSYVDMYSGDGKKTIYNFPKDWPIGAPAAKFASKNIDDLLRFKKLLSASDRSRP